MQKLITLLSILFISITTQAQIVTVKGKVMDYEKAGIRSVKIVYGSTYRDFTATNKYGEYSFKVNLSKLTTIQFIHVAYEVKDVAITKRLIRRVKDDTLNLDVILNDIELGEIEVGVKKPKVVIGRSEYSIEDYEITNRGQIVLLTYAKNLKKGCYLRLLDTSMVELSRYYLVDECIELRTDYRKNVHVVTTENVYLVRIENNRLNVYREDKDYYYKFLAPVVDTLDDRLYYSNYSEIYPAFDYMEFNKTDSIYTRMLEVKDEPLMEQYRAEFKFTDVRTKIWAHNKQIETGIDKEVWVGAAIFTNTVYYTPLYAPLFVHKDSVFVFDHYDNRIYKYLPQSGVVDSVDIQYHFNSRQSGWEQPLIQDKQGGKIYALFTRGGYSYLSLLNTNTGEIIKSYKLYYKYIEKIQIINNEAFYTYRPYESTQKKYVYKEKLK